MILTRAAGEGARRVLQAAVCPSLRSNGIVSVREQPNLRSQSCKGL